MENLVKQNFDAICRACFSKTNLEKISAFCNSSEEHIYSINVSELLFLYLEIRLDENDGFSANICKRCITIITDFYKFTVECRQKSSALQDVLCKREPTEDNYSETHYDKDSKDRYLNFIDIPPYENSILENFDGRVKLETIEENLHPEDECNPSEIGYNYDHIKTVTVEQYNNDITCKDLFDPQIFEQNLENIKNEYNRSRNDLEYSSYTVSFSPVNQNDENFKIKTGDLTEKSGPTDSNIKCTECNIKTGLKCTQCSRKLCLSKPEQSNHIETPYICPVCTKSFSHGSLLIQHIRKHSGDRPYSCMKCNKSFSSKSNLKVHTGLHTGEKPYTCSKCDKSFYRKAGLIQHLTTHTGETLYKCKKCSQSFYQESDLTEHLVKHTGEKPYSCSQCSKSFSHKSRLIQHLGIHTGEKYNCPQCSRSCSSKSNLNSHIRTHTGEKPHTCPHCSKAFHRKADLTDHLRKHTGEKPFTCPHCSKSFHRKSDLTHHVRQHSEKPHSCPECNKSFSSKAALNVHSRLHTGEKPYICLECGKAFSQNVGLVQHLTVHTGEKPYTCSECSRSFSHRSTLVKHKQIHR